MKLFGPMMALLQVLREITPDEVQRLADLPLTIGITGPSSATCDALVSALSAYPSQPVVAGQIFRRLPCPMPSNQMTLVKDLNIIVYVAGAEEEIPGNALQALRDNATGLTPLVVVIPNAPDSEKAEGQPKGPAGVFKKTVALSRLEPEQVVDRVVPAIVDFMPEHVVALGRRLPPFRSAASAKVIHDTSWANAKFAALSNLPALIPIVGNLIAATADFFVLTRNQISMLLKLAAIHGRDLEMTRSVILEIAPVVGAAFVWRTVARELTALLPGLLGAVPKVLIAFTGTYAVGRSAGYYYDQGRRPPADVVKSFYTQAAERASAVMPNLTQRSS